MIYRLYKLNKNVKKRVKLRYRFRNTFIALEIEEKKLLNNFYKRKKGIIVVKFPI